MGQVPKEHQKGPTHAGKEPKIQLNNATSILIVGKGCSNMDYPIYRYMNVCCFIEWAKGLICNSLLFGCILSVIVFMLFIYIVMEGINRMYGYIKKYKVIKYKLK